jgi:hypothetical protein
MIKVVRPSFFNMFKLVFSIGSWLAVGEVWSRYSRREYMRRVRERNRNRLLASEQPKQLGRLQLMTIQGNQLTPATVPGKFPVFFFGDFKTFINLLAVFSSSPYYKELHFIFVADEQTIQKLQSGAVRTQIPNA